MAGETMEVKQKDGSTAFLGTALRGFRFGTLSSVEWATQAT